MLIKAGCFIFGYFPFHMNCICVGFSCSIVVFGVHFVKSSCIIFEVAKVLNAVVKPSSAMYLVLQIFKTLLTDQIGSSNFLVLLFYHMNSKYIEF